MATAAANVMPVADEETIGKQALLKLFTEAQQFLEAKKGADALVPLRQVLQLCPDQPDAHNLTSVAFGQLGMQKEAIDASRHAIALKPDDAGFHLNLANRLNDQCKSDQAIASYLRALELAPDNIAVLKSYMRCLVGCLRWDDAKDLVSKLIDHIDDEPETLVECATVCINAGDQQQALNLYLKAIEIDPDQLDWQIQLTRIAVNLHNYPLTKLWGEKVLAQSENHEIRIILASAMLTTRKYDEVVKHLDAIPETSDQAANAANLRGMMLVSQAKIEEGLEAMGRTRTLAPKAFPLQATRTMYLNYGSGQTRESLRSAHRDFGQLFEAALPMLGQGYNDRSFDLERKLRIGFVSPDFRGHSVTYFTRPFFEAFDRERFDVIGYAHVAKQDNVTSDLRELATDWRDVVGWSDQKLAAEIRSDRIDILIDLAGLTRDTRLLAFTARPAPVQMTYIGYPNTTGLPQIDYRITDGIADPDDADDDYTETLIRLPGCFLCYAPITQAPDLEPGPCEHRDYVTFGSFNNFAKINPNVLDLWADVLRAVPNSKLLLKATASKDPTAQGVIRNGLAEKGIEQERVKFADYRKTPMSHLAIYNDVDIALDTFPYNGTTTTCEALWMGVPVITLRGDRHASRVGASLLSAVGFPAGIAESPEEYVATAKLMADHKGILKTTRRTLRDTMYRSPLCNQEAHARTLEEAFRATWNIWCEQNS